MRTKKNVPDIRFKGFAEEWGEHEFKDIASRFSTPFTDIELPRVEYEDIVSGQGILNKDISQKRNSKTGLLFYPGDILFGKLRPYLKNYLLADFKGIGLGDFWILNTGNNNSPFIYTLIQSDKFQIIANTSTGTKMPRSDWHFVSTAKFTIPSTAEQQAIGNYFQNIDRLINTSRTKLDKLKNIKKACLEKMFPRSGSNTSELRFKGFVKEWKHTYLKDTGNWDKGSGLPKVDLDKEGLYPCIHYGELFAYSEIIKQVISFTDKQSAKTSSDNDLLFPDSDVTPDGLGRCSAIETPNVILGGGINVLRLFKDFRAPYMSMNVNNNRRQIINKITGTTVRHVHSKDLNDIELFVSENLTEQQKIGDYFAGLDDLIAKTEHQINKLKNIKKACLDKMFVNWED